MLTIGLCAVVAVALGLVFWGVHRLERESFDRGTEYGTLWARVTSEPLPLQAVMHKDMVPRMVKVFAKRGRDLTVTGFHDCGDGCHRRDHPAENGGVDVVVT